MMINPLFNNSGTRQKLRDRAAIRVAARKELNRITSASLTSLRSNFKSADELEETIKKLEKQITTTPPNRTRLVGARKRVSNMRTPLARGGGFRRAGLIAMAATKKNNNGLESHPLEPNVNKEATKKAAKNITAGAIASILKKNKETENRRAKERVEFNKKKYQNMIEKGEVISNSDRKRIELMYNNLAKKLEERNAKEAANKKEANNKAAAEKKAANAKAAANAEKKAQSALKNYLVANVKPKYNKALVNAILRLPELNNNTRRRLQSPRMYALQSGAGAFRNRAVTAGGALGNKARRFFSRSATPAAAPVAPATGGGFWSRLFAPKPPPTFIPFKQGMKIPLGYVLKKNKNNKGLGYYKNNKALASQIEYKGYGPVPKPPGASGVSVGVGSGQVNRYGNNYGYGNNRGRGSSIVFAPKINVGAARIGAQTFGGTRVGGQQMGGSHVRTGNTGSTTLKTGNTGGTTVKTGNAGNSRLAVSAPTTNGIRQLAATPEQLIRGAGGAEAVEQGIKALNAANGNVTRAKAASRLPNNTFTNIYAMGGPVAAKKMVESRRRRRGPGALRAPAKKKRVARKPKKQYIKLTPYQFRRLTDHIKKNNLRKVLIKEITH